MLQKLQNADVISKLTLPNLALVGLLLRMSIAGVSPGAAIAWTACLGLFGFQLWLGSRVKIQKDIVLGELEARVKQLETDASEAGLRRAFR